MSALARLLVVTAGWTLVFVSSPGVVRGDGSAVLLVLGLACWAHAASQPGRRAFLVEWMAASAGFSALCWWSTYVWVGTLLAMAIVPALYMALAGVLLRRLARCFPLALAAPAAWVGLETLRALVEPPLGLGWLRVGHQLHHVDWLAGSARVWGVAGLSWVALAAAAGIAERARALGRKQLERETGAASSATVAGQAGSARSALALALGPLALALALGLATSAPKTVDGPRLLLVQPSFEAMRKQAPPSARELFDELVDLTRAGLARAPERPGRPSVDLVCWGETVLPWPMADTGLRAAWARGARPLPWAEMPSLVDIGRMEEIERRSIGATLFGQDQEQALLPDGASFLTGVELHLEHAGVLRRANSILLWGPDGRRAGRAGKVHNVPGGETMAGLERIAWVRDTARAIGGYVPDFLAADEPGVLDLAGRWRFGATVCFDNAFEGPYTQPLRAGALDFHLVVSNEAWYRESFEYDQMLAFSRLAAIATGRSFVRVTNSGVSAVLGPDGRELARLRVGERDRMVAGWLLVDVPVPAPGEEQARTPFVRTEWLWNCFWLALPLLLLVVCARRPVTARA